MNYKEKITENILIKFQPVLVSKYEKILTYYVKLISKNARTYRIYDMPYIQDIIDQMNKELALCYKLAPSLIIIKKYIKKIQML